MLSYFTGAGETSVTVNNVSDYTAVARMAPGYFEVFGATARTGRLFTREEQQPGGSDAVVISEAYWRRQFASDPRAIGSTITFGQRTRTIIGVTPLRYPARTDIYYPDPVAPESQSRTAHNYRGVGRLAAGVSVVQAQSEMTGIASRLEQQYPVSNGDKGIAVVPVQDVVVGDTRQTLFVLLAAVAFVLLIACANVANLLLARASARGRELVVRAAVGAGRLRLIRQMLTESVVLALLAGTGGVIIARWGVSALLALAPENLPRLGEVSVDATALMFALAISLAASVIFGLAPAWHVSRVDLADGLRQGGKGSALGVRGGWARKAFVVTEIALAVALVMGAGLLGAQPDRAGAGRHGLQERPARRAEDGRAGLGPRSVSARHRDVSIDARRVARDAGCDCGRRRHVAADGGDVQRRLLDSGRTRTRGARHEVTAGGLQCRDA